MENLTENSIECILKCFVGGYHSKEGLGNVIEKVYCTGYQDGKDNKEKRV